MTKKKKDFFTADEVADIFRCHKNTVIRMIKQDDIPGVKFGKKFLIPGEYVYSILGQSKENVLKFEVKSISERMQRGEEVTTDEYEKVCDYELRDQRKEWEKKQRNEETDNEESEESQKDEQNEPGQSAYDWLTSQEQENVDESPLK